MAGRFINKIVTPVKAVKTVTSINLMERFLFTDLTGFTAFTDFIPGLDNPMG